MIDVRFLRSWKETKRYQSSGASVSSRLHIGNVYWKLLLLIGWHVEYHSVCSGVVRRLQSVLHAAARLITGIWCYEHITPTLCDTLHWLRISQHVSFKIALMMFDCSRGRCPKYCGDFYTAVHTVAACSRLRSAEHETSSFHMYGHPVFGCCSFRLCGPTIWNKLPQDLQSTDTSEQFKP